MDPYKIPFYVVVPFLSLISLEENLNLKRDQSLNQRYLVLFISTMTFIRIKEFEIIVWLVY